jgi:hypothetical protein
MAETNVGTSPLKQLVKSGDELVEARRAWAEVFLLYKLGRTKNDKVTDNVAKARADLDVNLIQAEVNWTIAQELCRASQS